MKIYIVLTLLILGGCGGSAGQPLYLLDAQTDLPAVANISNLQGMSLGLGAIRLPAYLDRPQMIIAEGEHQYQLDEQRRWAERLDENIERSLLQSLSKQLPGVDVVRHPWTPRQTIDQQLSIDILQFHQHRNGFSQLLANWRLGAPLQQAVSQSFTCRIAADASQPEAVVHAQSQCLSRLSADIAAQFRQWAAQKNTPAAGQ